MYIGTMSISDERCIYYVVILMLPFCGFRRRHMMEEREAQRQMATKMMQSMMDDRDGGVRLGALQGLQAWSPAAMSPGGGPGGVGGSPVAPQPPPGHFTLSQAPVASPMC
jgi:hypothetical protein